MELIDGHSFDEIDEAVKKGKTANPYDYCKTTKGEGVSYGKQLHLARQGSEPRNTLACRNLAKT